MQSICDSWQSPQYGERWPLAGRAARRPVAAFFAAAMACCLFAFPAWAEDWPAFQGLRQNNTSAETGLLLDWPDKGPPVLWSKRLGRSYSPPVVARGALIAFHRIGDEEVIECLDARTGQSRWNFRYPTRYVDRYEYNGGPRSSPAIDGDFVYAYGAEGVLTCLALADGKKVWQRPLNKELEVPQGFFGVGIPPVIEKDIILLNAGGPGGAGVVGINKKTGETLWKASDHGAGYSAPVACTIGGRRMAVFFTKEGLLVVAPDTGKILHELPFRSVYRESVNAASPVVAGDVIFLSAAYYVGSIALQVMPEGPLKCLWRDKKNLQNHWATSIYHDGFLYGSNGRHEQEAEMRCLDWKTGEVRWTSPRGLGRATFIMAQGHFIAMGERGDLTLIEVNPERYVEKKRVRMLEYPCWGPPVLANNLLYIRNEILMVCLDLRAAK
jgi:outer membrane protein assembly factor BamB